MEAKELMIGDLVKVIHIDGSSDFASVSQVGTREIKTRDKNGYMQLYAMPMFEPIPLSKEILLANGFESITLHTYILSAIWEYSVQVSLYDDGCIINISKNLKPNGKNECRICYQGYVHELQHALRIVGLTDLADNFKVE